MLIEHLADIVVKPQIRMNLGPVMAARAKVSRPISRSKRRPPTALRNAARSRSQRSGSTNTTVAAAKQAIFKAGFRVRPIDRSRYGFQRQ
jgi:hypothetical protein